MTREQHSLTVAMDQTTVQKCAGSQRCRMIAWMSQTIKPFYKRRKKLIRAKKITLMFTWRLYYGGAVITSITVVISWARVDSFTR